ncbi:uncharacterized protein PG998_001507 [Apiospora kogelbergensis]|uniref:Restriction of telomere capping protein 4 n=1 Tax=Apiospora kogelbergensis TaxID=1337665 RepID=A0AAW0QV16_9PEZI
MTGHRVLGLSSKTSIEPLLSNFKSAAFPKMDDLKDINAPPESSDSESEAPSKAEHQDSGSDEACATQKDYKRTAFVRKRSRSPERGPQRNVRNKFPKTSNPPSGKGLIRVPGRQKPKTPLVVSKADDERGLFGIQPKPTKNKFGKQSQRSSQSSAPSSSAPQETSKKPELKRHTLSISPSGSHEKAATSKAKLIRHSPIKSSSKIHAKAKFRDPNISTSDPPGTGKSTRLGGISQRPEANGKQRPTFKVPTLDEPDEPDPVSDGGKIQKKDINEGKIAKVDTGELPKRPTLKVPELAFADNMKGVEALSTQQLGFMNDGTSNEGLKSEPSSDEDSLGNTSWQQTSAAAHCPMCGQSVDPELLERHTTRGRMTIRQQTTFCFLHKRREAEETRRSNRYPEVDWNGLEARFTEHKGFIKDILEGKRTSHFASLLSNKVEAGKDRTLLKTDESLTPGYYGPRGASTDDGTHHAFFLRHQLAVRLIMDDMDVDEEGARQIMQESGDLGDVLHEETRDVVVRDSDDED